MPRSSRPACAQRSRNFKNCVSSPDPAGTGVKLGALLWTERTPWRALLDAAVAIDDAGFDSIWCSDHLLAATGNVRDPCFEAWTTLAAIAASTRRATVGLLVGAVGLRNPGLVAKQAATLDHVSGGRFVLGLGSGWLEREYVAHGYTWEPSARARVEQLAEAIVAVRALLAGDEVDGGGTYYRFERAQQAPRPLQSRIPLLVGGEGRLRTLRVVAEHADMWNARGDVANLRDADEALAGHCAAVGRDPATIERLTNRWVVARPTRADAERELSASLAGHGIDEFDPGICALGPPDEIAAQLCPTLVAGFRHVVWSFRYPFDEPTIAAAAAVRVQLERG
jgi:alkanesulfonate monooxygenase SsuD/methylene tetrahydromethanopterin reductase-like flavin-dependent oxidoreductase (luciferase family)